MPIDITNKEEKQIALTGAQIEETLLQAHLSKAAIEKIEGLKSSASEIDGSVNKKLITARISTDTSSYFGKYVVTLLGDSISADVASYALMLNKSFQRATGSLNYGFIGENLGFDKSTTNKLVNSSAATSISGTVIQVQINEELFISDNYIEDIYFSENKIIFFDIETEAKTYNINFYYFDGTLISTQALSTNGTGKSSTISIPGGCTKIGFKNTSGNILNIENPMLLNSDESYTFCRLATSGRRLADVSDATIDKAFDNSEYFILALGTNDRNPAYYNDFAIKIDYIKAKFNNALNYKTKLIILDLNVKDDETTAMTLKLRELQKDCAGSYFVSIKEIFETYDYALMNTKGLLKADLTHPTSEGYKSIHTYICNLLGLYSTNKSNLSTHLVGSRYYKFMGNIKLWNGKNNISTNILLGDSSGEFLTTGKRNVSIGGFSLRDATTAYNIVNIGYGAGTNITTANRAVNIGAYAGQSLGTANSCVNIGDEAGMSIASGQSFINIGKRAGKFKQDGSSATSANNTICLGAESSISADNQIQLGASFQTVYAYGAIQDRSDIRDKADVEDTPLGLDFICKVNPVQYRWDYRDDYVIVDDETGETIILEKDGSKKRGRLHQGVIAQQVKEVIDELGIDFGGYQDHSLSGGCDVKSIGYQEFIPPLIKAIQELKAEIELLKKG